MQWCVVVSHVITILLRVVAVSLLASHSAAADSVDDIKSFRLSPRCATDDSNQTVAVDDLLATHSSTVDWHAAPDEVHCVWCDPSQ